MKTARFSKFVSKLVMSAATLLTVQFAQANVCSVSVTNTKSGEFFALSTLQMITTTDYEMGYLKTEANFSREEVSVTVLNAGTDAQPYFYAFIYEQGVNQARVYGHGPAVEVSYTSTKQNVVKVNCK